jgi:hypothetical protein
MFTAISQIALRIALSPDFLGSLSGHLSITESSGPAPRVPPLFPSQADYETVSLNHS